MGQGRGLPSDVSIHALAKRPTYNERHNIRCVEVSIHALAKRATGMGSVRSTPAPFQSTPSRRGRRKHGVVANLGAVSIHALAKRATRTQIPATPSCGFNPRPREEGDPLTLEPASPYSMFQSTPSRGGRPVDYYPHVWPEGFNPRPREEGDFPRVRVVGRLEVSIHALAKRATFHVSGSSAVLKFQSTPSRRGRHLRSVNRDLDEAFQSTPSRRGRLPASPGRPIDDVFQPTPSRRGRPTGATFLDIRYAFQSTPSRRGRQPTTNASTLPTGFQSTPSRRGRPRR